MSREDRSIPLPWALLAALGLAVFASVTTELLPPGVMLGMAATLDVAVAQIGLLVSVWAVTIVVLTVPLVRATARLPRKPLLVATLLAFAATNVVVAVVPVYGVVVGARVAGAAMAALSWSTMFASVSNVVPAARLGRAMSVVLGGGTLASVLGVPVGAVLAANGHWQVAFWGAAGVLGLSAAVLAGLLPARPGSEGTRLSLRRDPSAVRVLALLGAGALLLTGYMTLYAYIVPVLVSASGLAKIAVGPVLFVAGGAGAVGLVLSGLLGDRWPRGMLLALVAMIPLGAGVIAASASTGSPWNGVIGSILIGFGVGGFPPLFQAQVVRTASPGLRDVAASLFVVVLNVGIALGAALGGVLLSVVGLSGVAFVASAVAAAAVIAIAAAATFSKPTLIPTVRRARTEPSIGRDNKL